MSIRNFLIRALGLAAVVVVLFAGGLVFDGLTDEVAPSDMAVVLGNKVNPDGTPSARLAARLDRALDLYTDEQVRLILVSGGTGVEGVPEGDAMRDYLHARGVPVSDIIVDNAGVDTRATATNAAAVMRSRGLRSAIVVTQYFHVPRTQLAFRQAGIDAGSAHARYFEPRDLYSTAREMPAYLSYLVSRN